MSTHRWLLHISDNGNKGDAQGGTEEGNATLPRELEKRRRPLRGMEAVGRSQGSSPMRTLVQMVREVGPTRSMSCGRWATSGQHQWEGPHKTFLKGKLKKPQMYQLKTVAVHEIRRYQNGHLHAWCMKLPRCRGSMTSDSKLKPLQHLRRACNIPWQTSLRAAICALSTQHV